MRYWTEQEARAYLPRARALLGIIRQAGERAARARSNGQVPVGTGDEGGSEATATAGSPAGGDEPGATEVPDARGALVELAEASIVLRDPAAGLIDFPALGADGVVYLLCWQEDDGDLAWWHLPEEGFAGRKPLPRREPPAGSQGTGR